MPNGFFGSPDDIVFTNHVYERMVERGFSREDVRTIIRVGKVLDLGDGRYLVGIRPSPFSALDQTGQYQRLEDCSVLLTGDGVVVTVYHNDERCPFYWRWVIAG